MHIKKILFVALLLPVMAMADGGLNATPFSAKDATKLAPFNPDGEPDPVSSFSDRRVSWSTMTGFGYDDNAYQKPGSSYTDYAKTTPSTVAANVDSGFFVPYEAKMDIVKNSFRGSRVLVSGSAVGRLYLGAGVGNEYQLNVSGGTEYVLEGEGKSEDTFYVGAILEKDKDVLADHDSRENGDTALHDADILGRVSYSSFGFEAKYKHRLGDIDYGVTADYLLNDYSDPLVTEQLDHSFYTLGAEVSVPVALQTRWKFSYEYSVRDFSKRNARKADGTDSSSLLLYTYNTFGATILNQVSRDWLLFIDIDRQERADGNVGYDNCRENRFGARLAFERGPLKGLIGWHHSKSRYPNAFAFDNSVQFQKSKYISGNVIELRAEKRRDKNSSLWSEVSYKVRSSDDARYDYSRLQLMAGVNWAY